MATVVLLAIAVLLIDAHGPVVDCLPAVEGWLPGLSEVASIAADISHRVQVTDTAWPRVHLALRHVPWVVGRLGRFAIAASETFLVNREAMAGVGSRHLPHVAIDCHGRPRAILRSNKIIASSKNLALLHSVLLAPACKSAASKTQGNF